MNEREKAYEKVGYLVALGLMTFGLTKCAPPANSAAYYEPFTNRIVYEGTPLPSTIAHEEEHQKRAHEMGRFIWGMRYMIDPEFACAEEMAANKAGNIYPLDDHPACDIIDIAP